MEELDGVLRRSVHHGVVNRTTDGHRAHGYIAVGDCLSHRNHIRRDTEALRGKGLPRAAKATDHFIEDEQNSVLGADLAQPFKVAEGWHIYATGTCDRLDEAGRDVLCSIKIDHAKQVLCQFCTCLWLPRRETIFRHVGMPHVYTRNSKPAESTTVVHHASEQRASDIDAVIASLARDEERARCLTARPVISKGNLHRGIYGFRSRTDEKQCIQTGWK